MKDFFGFVNDALSDLRGNRQRCRPAEGRRALRGQLRPGSTRCAITSICGSSQKEPFDILYFTPALTTILNLNDRSFTLSPELAYTGITNLDLRLKASFINGPTDSEFGEKPFDFKLELRVGYYF